MAVPRLPLLLLGGEEAFDAYQAEFDRLYRTDTVLDVLGRSVEFAADRCRHICFKGEDDDPYGQSPRVHWRQARPERIGWILVALTDARTEVRPSHRYDNCDAYLVLVHADPANGLPQERFGVFVELLSAVRVRFRSAYPLTHQTWKLAREKGPRKYPIPPVAGRRPRRR